MSTLTISDLDEATLISLRRQAALQSQTVEAYARDLLRRNAEAHENRAEVFRRIRAMTPNVPQTNSTEIIRQIRDE